MKTDPARVDSMTSQSPRRGIGSPEADHCLAAAYAGQWSQSPRRGIGSPELDLVFNTLTDVKSVSIPSSGNRLSGVSCARSGARR